MSRTLNRAVPPDFSLDKANSREATFSHDASSRGTPGLVSPDQCPIYIVTHTTVYCKFSSVLVVSLDSRAGIYRGIGTTQKVFFPVMWVISSFG